MTTPAGKRQANTTLQRPSGASDDCRVSPPAFGKHGSAKPGQTMPRHLLTRQLSPGSTRGSRLRTGMACPGATLAGSRQCHGFRPHRFDRARSPHPVLVCVRRRLAHPVRTAVSCGRDSFLSNLPGIKPALVRTSESSINRIDPSSIREPDLHTP